ADPKIVQMMPADGWFAVYVDDDDDPIIEPVVCFALVQDPDGFTEVRPMTWQGTAVDFADEDEGFVSIEHISAAMTGTDLSDPEDMG
ncbi:MAG: hypothetical protein ACP5DC_09870, partial [Halothiobacillaceae bacterium]